MAIYFWPKEKKHRDQIIQLPYELASFAALRPVNNSSRLNKFKASNHSHVEISDKLVLAQLTVWIGLSSKFLSRKSIRNLLVMVMVYQTGCFVSTSHVVNFGIQQYIEHNSHTTITFENPFRKRLIHTASLTKY